MNKQSSKAMIERMEFVNCLNRELNRKVCAYDKVLTEVQKNRDWVWPSDTSEDKCSPQSIKRNIILLREQLVLLEKEVMAK